MELNFNKNKDGLLPAVIQDADTDKVLMLGYFNHASYEKTVATNRVTFFSRSKNRLWTKGEESGHFLEVVSMAADCDQDTLLVKVKPWGPVCHTGNDTCWNEKNQSGLGFLAKLETTIADRKNNPSDQSYVASLFSKGISKMAQKVGEEAVEVVIEAMGSNEKLLLEESADLLFHFMVLLQGKNLRLQDVVGVLEGREEKKSAIDGI